MRFLVAGGWLVERPRPCGVTNRSRHALCLGGLPGALGHSPQSHRSYSTKTATPPTPLKGAPLGTSRCTGCNTYGMMFVVSVGISLRTSFGTEAFLHRVYYALYIVMR